MYIYIYPHILGPLPVQEITHVLKPFQEPMQRVAFQMRRVAWQLNFCPFSVERWHRKTPTLLGTNISPFKGILKMIFLFPRWDMLIPWRVPSWSLTAKAPEKVTKSQSHFSGTSCLTSPGKKHDSGRGWTVALLSEGCGFSKPWKLPGSQAKRISWEPGKKGQPWKHGGVFRNSLFCGTWANEVGFSLC